MILRHLANSIRKQDWFTVVLEVMIVVVGIFIGLQVDDWNEARKERDTERRYLERLTIELAENLDQTNDMAQSHADRSAILTGLVHYLRGEEPGPPDEESVTRALCRWHVIPVLSLRSGTYDELVSTGGLAIISDQVLRERLLETYALHETTRRQVDLFGSTIREIATPFRPFLDWGLPGDGTADRSPLGITRSATDSCTIDLEGIGAVNGVIKILAQLNRSQLIYSDFRRAEAEAVAAVLERLESVLGRETGDTP